MNFFKNTLILLKQNRILRFLLAACIGLMICTVIKTWIPEISLFIEILTLAGIGFSLLDYDTGQKAADNTQPQGMDIPPGIYEYIAEILWPALYDTDGYRPYKGC